MENQDSRTEEQLRKDAYRAIIELARWNTGKNIPNILDQLSQKIERSGQRADTLAHALNYLTGAAVFFAAVHALIAYATLIH